MVHDFPFIEKQNSFAIMSGNPVGRKPAYRGRSKVLPVPAAGNFHAFICKRKRCDATMRPAQPNRYVFIVIEITMKLFSAHSIRE
jgi:hypothetical protein